MWATEGLYLEWGWLPDGNYAYGFMFIDVYDNYHFTEMVEKEYYY